MSSLFFASFPLIILLCLVLFVPSFIVIRWKSQPIKSFLVATAVMFLVLLLLGVLSLKSPDTYSELAYPDIVTFAFFGLLFLSPVLAIIQWFGRRRYRREKKLSIQQTKEMFE